MQLIITDIQVSLPLLKRTESGFGPFLWVVPSTPHLPKHGNIREIRPQHLLRADFFTRLQTYKAGQPMSTSGASVATFWPSLTKICFTSPA